MILDPGERVPWYLIVPAGGGLRLKFMPWAAEGTCPGELGRPGDGEAYCLRQGDGQVHGRLNFCCFAAKQQPGYLIVTASG